MHDRAGAARTLFDKMWTAHEVVAETAEVPAVFYIDMHLTHEVSAPHAFALLKAAGVRVRHPERTLATLDHSTPTQTSVRPATTAPYGAAAEQLLTLERNARENRIEFFGMRHPQGGIVHVIGPELDITQPGMTLACGDSHTSTHGAAGALAFGVGSTEVAHVLATQCLLRRKPKTFAVRVEGRPRPPRGAQLEAAVARWKELISDTDARFDSSMTIDASTVPSMIAYGTNPGMVVPITGTIPTRMNDPTFQAALDYMAFHSGDALLGMHVDVVFISSCTNGRLEDLHAAAHIFANRKVARGVRCLIVPGSQQVKRAAEQAGLAER